MTALIGAVLVGLAAWWVLPPRRGGHVLGSAEPHGPRGEPARRAWHRVRASLGPAARRTAARERARTVQALGALAAELEAGQPPLTALLSSGGEPSVWPATAAAIRLGEDVAGALRHDASARPVVRQLAACWTVSTVTGTGFAAAVARLAAAARDAESVRVDLEAELAGPRATARLLALLPLVGLGFGMMLGSDPLAWLLSTGPGLVCLTLGLSLTVLGAVWTGRIAASVERLL